MEHLFWPLCIGINFDRPYKRWRDESGKYLDPHAILKVLFPKLFFPKIHFFSDNFVHSSAVQCRPNFPLFGSVNNELHILLDNFNSLYFMDYVFVMLCYVMQAAVKNSLSTRQSLQKLGTNEMGTESNPVVVSVNNDKRKLLDVQVTIAITNKQTKRPIK